MNCAWVIATLTSAKQAPDIAALIISHEYIKILFLALPARLNSLSGGAFSAPPLGRMRLAPRLMQCLSEVRKRPGLPPHW